MGPDARGIDGTGNIDDLQSRLTRRNKGVVIDDDDISGPPAGVAGTHQIGGIEPAGEGGHEAAHDTGILLGQTR